MPNSRTFSQYAPNKSRIVEWSLVFLVTTVLVVAFVRQVRVVQGQMELASIKSTLGGLRTALVIDHLQRQVTIGRSTAMVPQRNPFELLQVRPANYLGNVSQMPTGDIVPGSWIFDAGCGCVGYKPMYSQWFESPNGEAMAWFRVVGSIGPLELVANEAYSWQGDVVI